MEIKGRGYNQYLNAFNQKRIKRKDILIVRKAGLEYEINSTGELYAQDHEDSRFAEEILKNKAWYVKFE